MQKRVIIAHGWDGSPDEGWFPWLKKELESRGFAVMVPALPDAGEPRIDRWVPALSKTVGTTDEQTFFVGHSMGCQAIARHLATLPDGVRAGGAVFVAGFFTRLTGCDHDAMERDVSREWLETPLDLLAVRSHLPRSVAIFSDDDPFVPLANQDAFRDALGSEIVTKHGKGHYSGSKGTTELPVALEAVLKLAA